MGDSGSLERKNTLGDVNETIMKTDYQKIMNRTVDYATPKRATLATNKAIRGTNFELGVEDGGP